MRYKLSVASTVTPLRINHWQPRIAASSFNYLFTFKITAGNSRSSSRFEEELEIWGGSWNLRQMEKGWILTCWRPPSNLPSYQTLARIIILFLRPATSSQPQFNTIVKSAAAAGQILSSGYYPATGFQWIISAAQTSQQWPTTSCNTCHLRLLQEVIIVSRASKPQLYNWHFHSPRSCSSWLGPGRDWMVLKR